MPSLSAAGIGNWRGLKSPTVRSHTGLPGGHEGADLARDAQDLRAGEGVHHPRDALAPPAAAPDEAAQVVYGADRVSHDRP